MDCQIGNCEAHLYVSEGMKDLKTMTIELSRGQQILENSMVKLTENFNEMQRINSRLETIVTNQNIVDSAQDIEIKQQRDYINRAIGILGALTFLVPIISSIVISHFK